MLLQGCWMKLVGGRGGLLGDMGGVGGGGVKYGRSPELSSSSHAGTCSSRAQDSGQ